MAPETFLPAIDSWLKDARISLLAIDEAHCVSTGDMISDPNILN